MDQVKYRPVLWSDIEGWTGDDHSSAYSAFLASARQMLVRPYRQGSGPVDRNDLAEVARAAVDRGHLDRVKAREFFEFHFIPHRIEGMSASGFVTGFYEPVITASRVETDEFPIPLLRRPDDLIDIDDDNRPPDMDPSFRFGRLDDGKIVSYHDRPAIAAGILDRQGLELVWLKDKTDAFFVHVQGSARVTFADGSDMRVTYAAKSGHPYTSLARVLCSQTGIAPEQMTSDRLADWMRSHPDQIDDLLAHNKSYIFFREAEGLSCEDGPVAAAKIPLIAGRSLAVDRLVHTFGTPFWVATKKPLPQQDSPFARLMIAHDTGSAIVGAARGDLFIGSGAEAGLTAGRIRHSASMIILVPGMVNEV